MNTPRTPLPEYATGGSYRALRSRIADGAPPRDCRYDQVIALTSPELTWSRLWEIVHTTLERHDYSPSTLRLYRCVLRAFFRSAPDAPADVTRDAVHNHLSNLAQRHMSASWSAMSLSVLRTVFDKLGGLAVTTSFRTPKRPRRLPDILSRDEIHRLLSAAPTTRDQLLLGLLYGCGLKPSEAVRLTWGNVDLSRSTLSVTFARQTRQRTLPLPDDLIPVLRTGIERCPPGDFIFQGRVAGTHLSTRMLERIVRDAAKTADIVKPVSAMILRHTFAVHCLEAGETVRAVQEALGHQSVETTRVYEQCVLPEDTRSPIDILQQLQGPTPPKVAQENGAAQTTTEHPLPTAPTRFDLPPAVEPFELPFQSAPSPTSRAAAFYTLLKTHILGRFLGARRHSIRSG